MTTLIHTLTPKNIPGIEGVDNETEGREIEGVESETEVVDSEN